jgi:hypothetical protein
MKALLSRCVDEMTAAIDRFPWTERKAYGDWLAQTYYYVRHSTRLLAAAAARFAIDDRGNALHHRFATHMAEEKSHERLCLHDLGRIDLAIDALPEHPSTRMFYEPQYYKIEHQGPMVLFGYILPLEAIGPQQGKRVTDAVLAAHGAKAATFLELHTEEDADHLEKALAALDGLGAAERALVESNMAQTAYGYAAMLGDIRARVSGGSR